MDQNSSISELIKMLWSREAPRAAEVIRNSGVEALPDLMEVLRKDDFGSEMSGYENGYIRDLIIDIGEPAFQELVRALQPESDMIRAAAKTLKKWGDKQAVDYLISAMLNENVEVNGKIYVIRALEYFTEPKAFQPLQIFINNEDNCGASIKDDKRTEFNCYLKSAAACALAKYGDASIMPAIFKAFSHVYPEYGTRESLELVIKTLRDKCIENGREAEFAHYWNQTEILCPIMTALYEAFKLQSEASSRMLSNARKGLDPDPNDVINLNNNIPDGYKLNLEEAIMYYKTRYKKNIKAG